jgi:hypothetical protein
VLSCWQTNRVKCYIYHGGITILLVNLYQTTDLSLLVMSKLQIASDLVGRNTSSTKRISQSRATLFFGTFIYLHQQDHSEPLLFVPGCQRLSGGWREWFHQSVLRRPLQGYSVWASRDRSLAEGYFDASLLGSKKWSL